MAKFHKEQVMEHSDEFSDEEMFEDQSEGEYEDETVGNEGEQSTSGYFAQLSAEDKKKIKMEQRQAAKERKTAKPGGALLHTAKSLWNELRPKDLSSAKRAELMEKMMALITGKIEEMVMKHDASRIIQCCLKYGNSEQRNIIASELKAHMLELSKSQYGKFIVSKILNFCPKYRDLIMTSFHGKVAKMIKHRNAAVVIEEAYSQFANSAQKLALIEEFYGPEYSLFKTKGNARPLSEIVAENPEKKSVILKHMKETIISLLSKGGITVGPYSIVHRVVLEYLNHLGDSDSDSQSRQELIDLIKEHLVTMLHTREGALVTQYCLLHASPKDRKVIIKTFKSFVHKIALEQYGHTVLLACFEIVDDTVLVGKSILNELCAPVSPAAATETSVSNLTDLLMDRYASRVFLHLLCGRSLKYQPQYVVSELEAMDSVKAITCKKSWENKQKELIVYVKESLMTHLAQDMHRVIRTKVASQVLMETIKHVEGDKEALLQSVVGQCTGSLSSVQVEGETAETKEVFHAVKKLKMDADQLKNATQTEGLDEHALMNRTSTFVLKHLIAPNRGASNAESSSNESATLAYNPVAFAQALMTALQPNLSELVQYCAENPFNSSGLVFILVALLEIVPQDTKFKQAVSSAFTPELNKKWAALIKEKKAQAASGQKKRKADANASEQQFAIELLHGIACK